MSTFSSTNVTDVNLVLKERTHKIKKKYSMHQYSNSYAYIRQLPNSIPLFNQVVADSSALQQYLSPTSTANI